MIADFKEDFKNAFNSPNSSHTQLIIINIVVFVSLGLLRVIAILFDFEPFFDLVNKQFNIPPKFDNFFLRPWTILTYAFTHSLNDILHIIFNMLIFYWFAKIIIELIGNNKVLILYVLGALSGGILYLLAYNFIPYYINQSSFDGMVGASAAVYAVVIAAATLAPNYTFYLLFLGPVKIKYIAAFYIVLSLLGTVGSNAGGNIAHLGGGLIGYFYINSLRKGNDYGTWIIKTINYIKSFFVSSPKIKVSYRKSNQKTSTKQYNNRTKSSVSQEEIDLILDKISENGYENLTKEEKQKLFNASE